jgi:hypothetical protein
MLREKGSSTSASNGRRRENDQAGCGENSVDHCSEASLSQRPDRRNAAHRFPSPSFRSQHGPANLSSLPRIESFQEQTERIASA